MQARKGTHDWRRVGLVCAAVITVTISCAVRGTVLEPTANAPSDRPQLFVANHHWQEVRVYVVHGHVMNRVLVGSLPAGTQKVFTLPRAAYSNEIRLQVVPVGGRTEAYLTQSFLVAGLRVELIIENVLHRSMVYVQ